ncbi:MAG: hypothetical protein IJ493_01105 [Clostridia bacterium]|nr:hypothetical protein [Clostridia bacterium]
MTGAYNLATLTGANVLYFNKRLFDELNTILIRWFWTARLRHNRSRLL